MMDSTQLRQAGGGRTGSRLAGAALVALLALAGCGDAFHERLEGGRHLPPGPGPGPAAPVLSAPPAYTAHQNGYRASATVPDGFTCAWTLTGGTLAGPADGAEVVFTAGDPGTLTLTCTFSDGTRSASASASAPVRTGPILTVPDRSVLHQGTDTLSTPAVAGASYRWSVAGARILRGQGTPRILVDNGGTASTALRAATPGPLALETPGRLLVTLEETGPDGGAAATTLEIPEQAEDGLPPAGLVYDPGVLVAIAGSPIEEVVQDSTGGSVAQYSVDPPLPAGLTLDPGTGYIGGTPTVASPAADYTITAANALGTTTAVFRLTVIGPITGLSYDQATMACTLGAPITPNAPHTLGGTASGFTVSPDLPPGLVLDPATGVISGTPGALAAPATYTVTAANPGGQATAQLQIQVAGPGPAITLQPADVDTFRFRRATFSAAAAGAGTLSYQWQANGADIPGATGSTYRTGLLGPADDGTRIRVVVRDTSGGQVTSDPATLTVSAPVPRFAFAANRNDGTVSRFIVDPATGQLRYHGYQALDVPAAALAVDPQGRYAFLVHPDADQVSAFTIGAGGDLAAQGGPQPTGAEPAALAVHPGGSCLYVLNRNSAGSAGSVSVLTIGAGGALAILGPPVDAGPAPAAIALDPDGRFAFVANGNGSVSSYRIDAGGALVQVVGSPFPAGADPSALAVDPTGSCLVLAARGAGVVQVFRIGAQGGLSLAGSTPTPGPAPGSLALDPAGRSLYVACRDTPATGVVAAYALDPATGLLTPVGTALGTGAGPGRVTVDPSGSFVYVANPDGNDVARFRRDPATGALAADRPVRAREQVQDLAVTFGKQPVTVRPRSVYWAFPKADRVFSFAMDPDTGSLASLGDTAVASLSAPVGVAADPAGRFVYVTQYQSDAIQGFTVGTDGTLIAGPALTTVHQPFSAAVEPSGRFLYVAGTSFYAVYRIDPDTGAISYQGTGPVPAQYPQLMPDPTGRYLFLATSNYLAAFLIDRDTGLLSAPAAGATQTTTSFPSRGMAVDPTGQYLYLAYGSVGSTGDGIWMYAIDPLGGGLAPLTPALLTPPAANLGLNGIVVEPTGRFLYTTVYDANEGRFLQQYGVSADGQLDALQNLAILSYGLKSLASDPSGRFLVEANPLMKTMDVLALDPAAGTPAPAFTSPLQLGNTNAERILPPVITATVR